MTKPKQKKKAQKAGKRDDGHANFAPETAAEGRGGELPGLVVPDTPLGKATQRFRDQCDVIENARVERDAIGLSVMAEMKREGKNSVRIQHSGKTYLFSMKSGKERLVCKEEKAA